MSNSLKLQSGTLESGSAMAARELTLIVAATNQMGIGRVNTLPWTGLKKEMAYFARVTKRATAGSTNAVIMGRKSWDSIPPKYRPLKDRTNIVITRNLGLTAEGSVVVSSVEGAIEAAERSEVNKAFIIGGAEIYKAALERKEARRILLTRVLSDFDCDTFFPLHLHESGKVEGWKRRSKEEHDSWVGEQVPEGVQEENGTRYVFEMWEKTES